jgi:hypothetical protein
MTPLAWFMPVATPSIETRGGPRVTLSNLTSSREVLARRESETLPTLAEPHFPDDGQGQRPLKHREKPWSTKTKRKKTLRTQWRV